LLAGNQSIALPSKELSGFVIRVGSKCTRIQPGDRVCAIGAGPYATVFRVDESLCHQVPLQVTFEEACCWPITYGAAYYSLIQIAHLTSGKTILIQAAASAAGQAAIQLAKALGAIVYVMVGSKEEYDIMESFSIPRDRIFSNNDENLAADIKALTQGRGFDVILNHSLTGEAFRHLWLATASLGCFIDASKTESSNEAALSLAPFQRGASFTVMTLELLLRNKPSLTAEILRDAGSNLRSLEIPSITSKTMFAASQIGDAFGHLQSHGNVGKTIVSFNHRDQVPISPSARNPVTLDKNSTYIIAGGLGGLGQSLALLLIEHGARNLVFLSRSGAKSDDALRFMANLAASNVVAKSYACDISNENALKGVLQQCSLKMPPIKGLIQSAAVLNDSVYENMTHEMWLGAIRPKIHGTRLLHNLLPQDMEFFVMLSSISGVVGNRSQANYAAGNTFQDALAQHRREQGLPAVSIDLGLMLDIGLTAQRGGSTNLKNSEAVGLHEHEFHAIVKAAIAGSYGQSQTPTQLITGLPTGGILRSGDLEEPFYYDDPRFSFLRKFGLNHHAEDDGGASGSPSAEASFIAKLAHCTSLQESSRLISNALCARLAKALQTAVENIDSGKPLHTYGVDSLMAVDFRTWILVQIKAEISLFDVLSGGSIEALASKIAAISKLVPIGVDRRGSLDERRGSLTAT
jgi:NADPH:quinone reductase-like Zn-dependent oxidoreductase/NADP-dependent 3-hydroxy acid dehydrogenase YdfG